ncbi:MAG: hypothetical protein K6E18_08125 [Lachnospiraceae bacterium]|nr:hypothetical protein [Lachnospiraceae bacterium]
MKENWMKQLLTDIGRIAGAEKTSHYQVTVLPQILADFYKMLQGLQAGKEASEQYRMEDGSMEIRLRGIKQADGMVKITSAGAYTVR